MQHPTTASAAALVCLSSMAHGAPTASAIADNPLGFDAEAIGTIGPYPLAKDIDVDISASLTALSRNRTSLTFTSFNPDTELATREVVGNDDRILVTDRSFPYHTFGKIRRSDGVSCSGTLIGPKHVLTARHCMNSAVSMAFSPAFNYGDVLTTSYISSVAAKPAPPNPGSDGGWCTVSSDWAIAILNDRIGDQLGWLGLKQIDPQKYLGLDLLSTSGYPVDRSGGQQLYIEQKVALQATQEWCGDVALFCDNDSASGMSGGVLWSSASSGTADAHGSLWGGGQWAGVTPQLLAMYASVR